MAERDIFEPSVPLVEREGADLSLPLPLTASVGHHPSGIPVALLHVSLRPSNSSASVVQPLERRRRSPFRL